MVVKAHVSRDLAEHRGRCEKYGEQIANNIETLTETGEQFVRAASERYESANFALEDPSSGRSFETGATRARFTARNGDQRFGIMLEIDASFSGVPFLPTEVANRLLELLVELRPGEIAPARSYGDFPWL